MPDRSGINHGRLDLARLRRALTSVPLPRAGDGRLVLAVDVSPWLRPDADTSSDRSFCHTVGRGLGKHQMVPGRPYSIVAALETGRTSWAALLDAGYDAPRIAHLLADLPVEVLGRIRSDRVMRKPVPVPWICPPQGGRPPQHGGEFVCGRPASWGEVTAATVTNTDRYGTATAQAWDWLHPRLTRRAAWIDHEGPLPTIEGTVIRLAVEKLPNGGVNRPVWLSWSGTGAGPADIDRCWQAFLRRFDVEHTFRLLKQTLGWTRPKLRDSATADRWTWLVLAAHAQLRLARPLARDLRRPWERPPEPNRLTPARVRRGSGTCTRRRTRQPVHQNPLAPAPDARSARRTDSPPPATTSDASSPPASPTSAPLTTRRAPNRAEAAAPRPPFIATIPTMLDSGMVRRKKEKKKRPTWGIPKGIVLLATPEGWRFMIQPVEGGMLCGRLDIPIKCDPQDARAAAAIMVVELARDIHDTDVEVTWDPPPEPWSWTAQVTLATPIEPAPSGTGG